jgi:hypothetical protein
MVQRIDHYQCDCHRGTLEEISKTQFKEPSYVEDYGWSSFGCGQTIFYKCNSCRNIYQKDDSSSKSFLNGRGIDIILQDTNGRSKTVLSSENLPRTYTGRLTEQEIFRIIPEFSGLISDTQENNIIQLRNRER